jgi:integrase/recombinase XerD
VAAAAREKGGKRHEMPVHHKLEQFPRRISRRRRHSRCEQDPLFRSALRRTGILTHRPMHRIDAYQMVRRRTAGAGLKGKLGCDVFRATGITASLEAGGTLKNAQAMAAHESPRTTSSAIAPGTCHQAPKEVRPVSRRAAKGS